MYVLILVINKFYFSISQAFELHNLNIVELFMMPAVIVIFNLLRSMNPIKMASDISDNDSIIAGIYRYFFATNLPRVLKSTAGCYILRLPIVPQLQNYDIPLGGVSSDYEFDRKS